MKAWLKKFNVQIYLFVGCFALNLIGILALNTLVLSDEIGTIANGAYFAGIDWSEAFAITGLNYYKYGQALIYILLFKVFDNYVVIYRMALAINAIFISLIPCIVYSISNRFLKFRKRQAVVVACVVGLLPSSMLWSKSVWAETLLYFIPWVVLYLLLDAENYLNFSKVKKAVSGILIGIVPICAYMVHARGVVLPIAVVIVILYMKLFKKISLVNPLYYIIGLVSGFGIDKIFSNYLFKNLWLSRSTNNSIDSTLMYIKKYDLLSWAGLRTFLNTILGWLYSVIGSSYGLVTIGFLIAIVGVIISIKKKASIPASGDILYSFSALIFMGSFALGILFFIAAPYEILNLNTGDRFDKLIYGRYLAPAFGPLILVVYYEIFKNRSEFIIKYKQTIIILTTVVLGVFLIYYSGYTSDTTISVIQICTLPMFLSTSQGVVEQFAGFEMHMMLCTFIIFAGFIFVMINLKKKNVYLVTEVLSTVFIFTYLWSIFTCYKPINDIYNDEIKKTEEIVEDLSSIQNEYPYMAVNVERGTFAYQFAFSDYQIIGKKQGLSDTYDNLLVVDNQYKDGTYLFATDYYRFNEDSNVIVKGNEINSKINELGIETEKITVINVLNSFALYDNVGARVPVSGNLLSAYTYFSSSKISVTKGKYRLNMTASDISKDDISFKVEGRDGKIKIAEISIQDNVLSYTFDIKHTKDNLQFEISNISDIDKEVTILNLEKVE